jgi:hypothetical protein
MTNIAMVTFHTKSWQELVDVTFPGKLKYAERHGHTFYYKDDNFVLPHLGAEKCHWIEEIMTEHPEHDWIWWSGTDCLITNHNHSLHTIVDAVPDQYDFVICKDHHGINADVFFIRNTEWGRNYMRHLWESQPTHNSGTEQGVMWDDEYNPEYRDRTLYLPMTIMNQYTIEHHHDAVNYARQQRGSVTDVFGQRFGWIEGDFVLQIIGRDLAFKLASLRSKAHLVIE